MLFFRTVEDKFINLNKDLNFHLLLPHEVYRTEAMKCFKSQFFNKDFFLDVAKTRVKKT